MSRAITARTIAPPTPTQTPMMVFCVSFDMPSLLFFDESCASVGVTVDDDTDMETSPAALVMKTVTTVVYGLAVVLGAAVVLPPSAEVAVGEAFELPPRFVEEGWLPPPFEGCAVGALLVVVGDGTPPPLLPLAVVDAGGSFLVVGSAGLSDVVAGGAALVVSSAWLVFSGSLLVVGAGASLALAEAAGLSSSAGAAELLLVS